MKILYGVGGQGMGHATRSSVGIEELSREHDIRIVTGGQAFEYLNARFPQVTKIHTLHQVYIQNRTLGPETITSNIKSVPQYYDSYRRVSTIVREWKPDVVLCDLELFSALAAKMSRLPLLSIDNQHILTKTRLNVHGGTMEFTLKLLLRSIAPRATDYLITTFFRPQRTGANVHFVPPILRKEVLALRPSEGKHVLVYQTSSRNISLLRLLRKLPGRFIVYGYNRERTQGNVTLRRFNTDRFLRELASCRAVLTNGGFSLITESIALGKPVLSLPIADDFEQYVNAYELQIKGYGMNARTLSDEVFGQFIEHRSNYRKNLSHYSQDGNKDYFRKLHSWITLHQP